MVNNFEPHSNLDMMVDITFGLAIESIEQMVRLFRASDFWGSKDAERLRKAADAIDKIIVGGA